MKPQLIQPGIVLRQLRLEDAGQLAQAYERNKEHLATWEPLRSNDFFTPSFQRHDIAARLERLTSGGEYPLALDDGGEIVGRFTLSGIVRGAFQSASLGYWVDAAYNGRGLASSAVKVLSLIASRELGLHRIEAGTLIGNHASQRVLVKSGFQRFGTAPGYLKIAGRWQDHHLYQLLMDAPEDFPTGQTNQGIPM